MAEEAAGVEKAEVVVAGVEKAEVVVAGVEKAEVEGREVEKAEVERAEVERGGGGEGGGGEGGGGEGGGGADGGMTPIAPAELGAALETSDWTGTFVLTKTQVTSSPSLTSIAFGGLWSLHELEVDVQPGVAVSVTDTRPSRVAPLSDGRCRRGRTRTTFRWDV